MGLLTVTYASTPCRLIIITTRTAHANARTDLGLGHWCLAARPLQSGSGQWHHSVCHTAGGLVNAGCDHASPSARRTCIATGSRGYFVLRPTAESSGELEAMYIELVPGLALYFRADLFGLIFALLASSL